jgi:hypothetical protein
MSRERLRAIVNTALEVTAEPPRPLMRELPSADPFPVDALGNVLAPAARAIHDRVQAPLAICGQSVIATATLTVQAHADVTLPIGGGRTRPISNYFASVAATGERKSECDQQSSWPIRKHEKALRDKYDADLPAYINDKAGWDKARDTAIKRGKGDRAAIKDALNALGPEPTPPLVPMLTCPEPTFEGLCKLFRYWPVDVAAGTRLWREEQPETDRDLRRYGARLLEILETPWPLANGKSNELAPRSLPLSPAARPLWIGFVDHVEKAIAPAGPLNSVSGIANKLPEHAARLAAVLTLVRDIHAITVDADEMEAGIALAEHYAAEALRLFGASQVDADLRLARGLLSWLLDRWKDPAISLPDIYQRSLNAIGDQATARRLVALLEDHGWLVRIAEGALVAGQRRREAWLIVRRGVT